MRALVIAGLVSVAGVAAAGPARTPPRAGAIDYGRLANRIYAAKKKGLERRIAAAGGWRVPRLPAVEAIAAGDEVSRPFEGYSIFGLQHLVASTESLVELLERGGARRDARLEGKIYSEHPLVVEEMRRRGRVVGRHPWGEGPDLDPRSTARQLVDELVVAAKRDPHRKFLILDDGADLIEQVDEAARRHPSLASRVVGVQQTKHGTNRLSTRSLSIPVVDIGDAWAKRTYEAPAIGRAIALHTDRQLQKLRKTDRSVVVFGYGPVGRSSARSLKRLGYAVSIWDPDSSARVLAAADGVPVHESESAALAAAGVVLGTTGRVWLDRSNAKHLRPGTVLINGASNETEFDAFDLHDARPDLTRVKFLRPVNFGALNPVPARYIQLTRGLLYLAARTAVTMKGKPGLYRVDEAMQQRLVGAVKEDLAQTNESLEDPSFELEEARLSVGE